MISQANYDGEITEDVREEHIITDFGVPPDCKPQRILGMLLFDVDPPLKDKKWPVWGTIITCTMVVYQAPDSEWHTAHLVGTPAIIARAYTNGIFTKTIIEWKDRECNGAGPWQFIVFPGELERIGFPIETVNPGSEEC